MGLCKAHIMIKISDRETDRQEDTHSHTQKNKERTDRGKDTRTDKILLH